jgi:hypothetical protein
MIKPPFRLTVEPEELFVVRHIALPLQKNSRTVGVHGQSPSSAPEDRDRRGAWTRIEPHAVAGDGFIRPPFTHPEDLLQMDDSSLLGSGRHHFSPSKAACSPRAPSIPDDRFF